MIPIKYTLRNFGARKLTTGITVTGIALVVFVFAAVLMMAYGIQKTLKQTGSEDNVHITRKSSSGEITSIIPGEEQNIIKTLPYIASRADGKPIISMEPVVIINLEIKTGGMSNVTVRGVSEPVFDLRPQVKITEGRMFRWGARELIVANGIHKKFKNANIGDRLKMAGDYWTVVGIMDAGGSGFDSEVWGDEVQLLTAFNRGTTVSVVTFKMKDKSDFEKIKESFRTDKRLLEFEPEIEQTYYEKQSEAMSMFIKILGLVVTVIFSIGATIGAMITMYAAVANRTVEIGTLRALGFKRRTVLAAFLIESLMISIIGWLIGIALASVLSFFNISTINFASFSEVQFSFAIKPSILIISLVFSLLMGFIGGFLPAFRAARLNIVNALRAL